MKYLLTFIAALWILPASPQAAFGGVGMAAAISSMNTTNMILMMHRSRGRGGYVPPVKAENAPLPVNFQDLPPEIAFLKDKPTGKAWWRFGRRLWVGCWAVNVHGEIPGRATYAGDGHWNFRLKDGGNRYFLSEFQDNGYSEFGTIGEPRIKGCFSSEENAVKYALRINGGRR